MNEGKGNQIGGIGTIFMLIIRQIQYQMDIIFLGLMPAAANIRLDVCRCFASTYIASGCLRFKPGTGSAEIDHQNRTRDGCDRLAASASASLR